MKKQFFTFLMMIALVIVAGSAMAQTKTTPYQGASYTYTLSTLALTENATATMFLNNSKSLTPGLSNTSDAGNWSISSVTTNSGTPTLTTNTQSYSIPLTSSESALTFTVNYGESLNTGTYYLFVNVVNVGGSNCSNFIMQTITVTAKPTLALALSVDNANVCQTIAAVGSAVDNTAASTLQTTTFTYIVTPTATPASIFTNATYSFNFKLDSYTLGANSVTLTVSDGAIASDGSGGYNITGATSAVTITASVSTTTGVAAKIFEGSLQSGSLVTNSTVGGGSYVATLSGSPKTVTVGSTPTLGSFNL